MGDTVQALALYLFFALRAACVPRVRACRVRTPFARSAARVRARTHMAKADYRLQTVTFDAAKTPSDPARPCFWSEATHRASGGEGGLMGGGSVTSTDAHFGFEGRSPARFHSSHYPLPPFQLTSQHPSRDLDGYGGDLCGA
ncbi:unnamed protein product [Schistocephalus solidus]|uniref:Secreted protein n=1 Tax=Schistocephalus solidus TaxID=70667 RepID=A0A183SQV5_SCHSO|nr:unnamed protein product [Schistocephalus solidus]